jgi:hypothetical protein
MDILIKTSDNSEVNRWNTPPGRVNIPGSGDVVFPAPDDRPLAIGPDHFLATATVVDEDIGDGQKRGPETVGVVGQAVTVTRTSVAKTEEDVLNDWANLRAERNAKLVDSDWTQYNDSPLTDEVKAEWAVHRQSLRDLPENTDDPADPTWPTPPG